MRNIAFILISLSLFGCGDNDLGPERPKQDAGDGVDSGDEVDAPPNPFTVLARFDPSKGELPEGVTTYNGAVYVGLAPLAKIVKITAPGMVEPFATISATASNTYTVGLAANQTTGDIFVGVGATGASPTPAPGVYRIPSGSTTPTLFASSALMQFPNGIDIDGGKIFATDSTAGRILEISQQGMVTVWLEDPLLLGDKIACGGTGAMFPIGANGITHDATSRYVAVTDFGRIVRVPLRQNGAAGTPVVLTESCENLHGIDGIALEPAGTIVAVRNGTSNRMSRISADGQTVTPIFTGAPLDGPASITYQTGTPPRLVLTNSAFFSGATGKPSVLALPL